MENETDLEQKVCEACGEPFGCGAKIDGCWCAEISISPEAAADLKAKFNECLCPACLRRIAKVRETS